MGGMRQVSGSSRTDSANNTMRMVAPPRNGAGERHGAAPVGPQEMVGRSGTASSPQGRSEPAPDPRNPVATRPRQRGGWSRPADTSPDGEPPAHCARAATRGYAQSVTTGVGRRKGTLQPDSGFARVRPSLARARTRATCTHARRLASTHTREHASTPTRTRARMHTRAHAQPPQGKLASSPMISVVCRYIPDPLC